MAEYVPEKDPGDDAEDPLHAAESAMEEHEIDLCAAFFKRTIPHVPKDLTRDQQLTAIRKMVLEDPETRALYLRLKVLQTFGGRYVRSLQELENESLEEET